MPRSPDDPDIMRLCYYMPLLFFRKQRSPVEMATQTYAGTTIGPQRNDQTA